MMLAVSNVSQIKDSRKFEFEKPVEVKKWENGDVFVADYGYIDEVGNVKLFGIVLQSATRFFFAELNGIGRLENNVLKIEDIDDGVADKEIILSILNESAEMAKKGWDNHIEFWDMVLPSNIQSVDQADEYVKRNWVDIYKKYIEMIWC